MTSTDYALDLRDIDRPRLAADLACAGYGTPVTDLISTYAMPWIEDLEAAVPDLRVLGRDMQLIADRWHTHDGPYPTNLWLAGHALVRTAALRQLNIERSHP